MNNAPLCERFHIRPLIWLALYQPSMSLPIGEREPKNQKSVHAKWIQCGSTERFFFFFLSFLSAWLKKSTSNSQRWHIISSSTAFLTPCGGHYLLRQTSSPVSNKLSRSVCDARWLLLGPLCSMNTELSKVTRKKITQKKDKGREKQELAPNKACANSTIKQYC